MEKGRKKSFSSFLFKALNDYLFRTEGYYKMDPREKFRTKYHFHRPGVDAFNTAKIGHGNSQKPQVYRNFFYYLSLMYGIPSFLSQNFDLVQ